MAIVPLLTIRNRIQRAINNLDTRPPTVPGEVDPYVADAKAFAVQAKVCVDKQIKVETP